MPVPANSLPEIPAEETIMAVTVSDYGTFPDGRVMHAWTLSNSSGMKAVVSDYGADLLALWVPDKEGNLRDVVLGQKDAAAYEEDKGSLGAVVGRHANRIAGASFELNGKTYQLLANDGTSNLHSQPSSYYQRFWRAAEGDNENGSSVILSLESPDGDQGFPGNLQVTVTYTLTEDNSLILRYQAVSDADTIVNLTNHSYFNLDGCDSGSVLDQKLTIFADAFTPSDARLIPTGEICPVAGTPFDFRTAKTIGRDIHADDEQIRNGGGYDHNFVLRERTEIEPAAILESEKSGIRMEVSTDLPGMQLYTANSTEMTGKNSTQYKPFCGVCFETQYFPDSIHHPNFPDCVLKAGREAETVTVFHFA